MSRAGHCRHFSATGGKQHLFDCWMQHWFISLTNTPRLKVAVSCFRNAPKGELKAASIMLNQTVALMAFSIINNNKSMLVNDQGEKCCCCSVNKFSLNLHLKQVWFSCLWRTALKDTQPDVNSPVWRENCRHFIRLGRHSHLKAAPKLVEKPKGFRNSSSFPSVKIVMDLLYLKLPFFWQHKAHTIAYSSETWL